MNDSVPPGLTQAGNGVLSLSLEEKTTRDAAALLLQKIIGNATLGRAEVESSYPKELVSLGIKEYRQTMFKPYRVIYRVSGRQVIIYLIADDRRDMQTILARRLLGA